MNSIISPWVFYWASVANVSKYLASLVALFVGTVIILLILDTIMSYKEEYPLHLAKILGVVMGICIALYVFIPSEETCYKMIAANMFTQENIETASDYVTDVIDYAVDKVKDMKQEDTE